jgi:hypothetical protein
VEPGPAQALVAVEKAPVGNTRGRGQAYPLDNPSVNVMRTPLLSHSHPQSRFILVGSDENQILVDRNCLTK